MSHSRLRTLLKKALLGVPGLGALAYAMAGRLRGINAAAFRRNRELRMRGAPDGLPLPPGYLVFLVTGSRDLQWFLDSGKAGADAIHQALNAVARPLTTLDDVLDWGCGCGRVLRHLHGTAGPRLHGCDYNPALIEWSSRAYPAARFTPNKLAPPLPYEDQRFDLVYGLSVLTHLTAPLQDAWLAELSRVLRPEGLALLTVHGRYYLGELEPAERSRFEAGELVIREGRLAGSNLCATYHPESAMRALAARHGFEVALMVPEGAKGNPYQDLYLLKRAR